MGRTCAIAGCTSARRADVAKRKKLGLRQTTLFGIPKGSRGKKYIVNVTQGVPDASSMMTNLFQNRYYKINNFLLSTIGQWPYQSRARRRMILITFIFLATSQIVPQILAVVESWDDPEVVIESIPPFVIDIACGVKLANIIFNSGKMLELANRMEIDWKSLTHQPEVHVLHLYAEVGRQFTIAYAVGVYAVSILFMTQPVFPQILKSLKGTGDSQPKIFMFPVNYYGIDLEAYYYYMVTHSYICVTAIITVIVAADTMFIVHVQHACGMFMVVGRQLERMGDAVPENFDVHLPSSKDPTYQKLAAFIENHTKAIKFANLLETSYTWSFFSVVGFNMVVMSVTGFQTVVRLEDSFEEALRYGAFTIAQLVHLFFQCFFSQRLMDHSEGVRDYMYQARWYRTSLCAQKLLNLITMRTYVPCQLTAGKFMVMSLDNFTSIVKTSMSYFTLLRSMQ